MPLKLTSSIAVGNDKTAVTISIGSSVPDHLVEKTWKADGVVVGTGARHNQVREGDMFLVVLAVSRVTSFPARGEHDFEANAIGAMGIEVGLFGEVMAVKSSLWVFGVVETVEAESSLG